MVHDPIARLGRAMLLSMLALLAPPHAAANAGATPVPMLTLPAKAIVKPVLACDAAQLNRFDRLPNAPTEIASARLVAQDGARAEHCLVSGYVWPQVKFELRLPTIGYTGRYLQIGCGGNCGFIRPEPSPRCDDAMAASGAFAVAATDAGHSAASTGSLWARDNRALQDDFAERGVHVVSIAAKAIIGAFYGKQPDHSYFQGCSDGGREAMKEAQRYPGDFDGLVAGAPANYISTAFLKFAWQLAHDRDAAGAPIMSASAVKTLHAAVMRACDGLDGLVDGQIDDPRACTFDPATLACPGDGAERPGQCLGGAQVRTARAVQRPGCA
ncbi:tannase/feruloyl esterase family alpha/beta hydrolase [Telluria beijingensis]|uniref:tannase/feruloyl esterase family alpha/beta hydrolase n=1 Tax=Telluria beijingensis TaxID=3068633 RepID=UPI0027959DE6|nr:tannase/feruloyl esterase family alpha/beta hydrolase [Massilia sp. REN29]